MNFEKNLDGMLRRNKGKGVDIDIDGGFVCQDSDSSVTVAVKLVSMQDVGKLLVLMVAI